MINTWFDTEIGDDATPVRIDMVTRRRAWNEGIESHGRGEYIWVVCDRRTNEQSDELAALLTDEDIENIDIQVESIVDQIWREG